MDIIQRQQRREFKQIIQKVENPATFADTYVVRAELVENGKPIQVFQTSCQVSREMVKASMMNVVQYAVERALKEIEILRKEYEEKERFAYYEAMEVKARVDEEVRMQPLKRMLKNRPCRDDKVDVR